MWTKQHRKTYKRSDERYPSDLTDAEWAHLEPLIPPAKSGGRPRGTDMREAINAILYILRTGVSVALPAARRFPTTIHGLQHLPQLQA